MKAPAPILVSLLFSSKMILVRLVQPEKTVFPMLVTLSGILIVIRLVQSRNAQGPMLITLSGIVMPVKLVQPAKA